MEKNRFTVPVAIIIAGMLIAGALYYTKNEQPTSGTTQTAAISMRGVSPNEHILGSPDAKVVIVEYSDTECPYCKVFHETMHRIIDEYGKDGTVAWVYRHFPLIQLHSKAVTEAEATECAAELGGNTAFWNYLDQVYAETPSNNRLDLERLPQIAVEIGLDRAAFESCLASERHLATVQADFDEAVGIGGRGTPHSVLLSGGRKIDIPGGQTYETMKSVIEAVLAESNTLVSPGEGN
jgi:protein-disulfide isomerase